jgi:hypothetical protein
MAGEGGQGIFLDSKELSAFAANLKESDPIASKQMRRTIRKLANPLVGDVRSAALRLPSSNGDAGDNWKQQHFHVSLRQGLAAAVKLQVSYGKKGFSARIRVSGTDFMAATGKYRKLPRYVEGMGRKPWRHPVYATKGATNGKWQGAWTEQKPTPFLIKTVSAQKDKLRAEIAEVFVDVMSKELNKK